MVMAISKYGEKAPAAPANALERMQLCGFSAGDMEDYWQARGSDHATFFIAGQTEAPQDSVRLWKTYADNHPDGSAPDLTPQPTGNCVAAAVEEVIELLQLCEIAAGDAESYRPLFNPYHYATGRVLVGKNKLRGGAGSIGGWQAKALETHGVLYLQDILPQYNKKNVDAWGDDRKAAGQSFRDYMEVASKNLVRSTSRIDSMGHIFEALSSKYPLTIASNTGYNMLPGRDGLHRVNGNWSHQLQVWGYGRAKNWIAIKNQWGDVHGQVFDPETGEPWPRGFICAYLDEFERRHFRGSETISYSRFDGYPEQKYDHSRWA